MRKEKQKSGQRWENGEVQEMEEKMRSGGNTDEFAGNIEIEQTTKRLDAIPMYQKYGAKKWRTSYKEMQLPEKE